MIRCPAPVLVILLLAAGCADPVDAPIDDIQRLNRLDRRLGAGEFDYALAECTKYVQEYPRSFRGWTLLGWAYARTDELEKADECFDKSLEINPEWDNAHVGKGAVYRKQGDVENARKSYLAAIAILPENAEAYASLLVIELMEGNDQRAVEYGERAWELRQDDPTIAANLAVAYHYAGDLPKRDEFYRHAERLGYHRLETIQEIFDGTISIR